MELLLLGKGNSSMFQAVASAVYSGNLAGAAPVRIYNISSLLNAMVPVQNEVPEVLTVSRADKKSIPPGINKRAQVRTNAGENVIPGVRNFR